MGDIAICRKETLWLGTFQIFLVLVCRRIFFCCLVCRQLKEVENHCIRHTIQMIKLKLEKNHDTNLIVPSQPEVAKVDLF